MRAITPIAFSLALTFAAAPALAQTPLPRIIRGEIVSVDGANLAVKTQIRREPRLCI